jgi:Tol biopolymer transport system component
LEGGSDDAQGPDLAIGVVEASATALPSIAFLIQSKGSCVMHEWRPARMGTLVIAAAVVATIALTLVSPRTAYATTPGENGRIVFRRYFNDAHTWGALFSIRPDGARERQITHPKRKVLDDYPDVSRDGRWLVYAKRWQLRRTASGDPRGALFRIRMNGTHRENLTGDTCRPTDDCVRDFNPNWSPDGRWIAFSRVFRSESRTWEIDLFVMRSNGSHLQQITAPGPLFEDYAPEWSPDGTRLVFFRFNPDRELHALFTVDPDGSDLRRLTTWHLNPAQGDDWSPDGRWILFAARPEGQTFNLRMIHPNGTGLRRITHSTDMDWLGSSFSPEGNRIVAGRTLEAPADSARNADLFVMRLDGSHRRNITRTELWDSAPDWGPRRT